MSPTDSATPLRDTVLQGCLLTRQWRDRADRVELELWLAADVGPVRVVVPDVEPVCFVERHRALPGAGNGREPRREPVALVSLEGVPMDALYFQRQASLGAFRERAALAGIALYESDIRPADRYLMERFCGGSMTVRGCSRHYPRYLEIERPQIRPAEFAPDLQALAIDIETSVARDLVYSVALSGPRGERVLLLDEQGGGGEWMVDGVPVQLCPDEVTLLRAFLDRVSEADPDLVIGWNVTDFDLRYLAHKCRHYGIPFAIGRAGAAAALLPPGRARQGWTARVPGRVVLDGIETLRAAFWRFENYSLEAVAQQLLGRGKRIDCTRDKLAEIERMYRADRAAFVAYNLEDCRLVREIFRHAGLIDFVVERARLTGLALGRHGGSVAAFDNLYLPRLHRRGFVAGDTGAVHHDDVPSPGGFVLDSQPGLYENVLLLDFKSLYPSIIRTFRIDPLGLHQCGDDPVTGFLGARFARQGSLLADIIEALWARRDQAKRDRNSALSQAVKIIMNSFYGVLGASGCRFFDPRLANSITRRGHEIIRRSRDQIEARSLRVIYGDTDSLFVLLGPDQTPAAARQLGGRLAAELNDWWRATLQREHRLDSFLEIQFETHFVRFLMPTVRGSAAGSKKRYAGFAARSDGSRELVFRGLESVRTDWTLLARAFQRELYRRIFLGEPFEEYVREVAGRLARGELDDQLIYRKRLRRRLDEYVRNVPPHVQAARKLERAPRCVSYVITRHGPEPIDHCPTDLDYDHYRDRQLKPVADAILQFLDTSFDRLTGAQYTLF